MLFYICSLDSSLLYSGGFTKDYLPSHSIAIFANAAVPVCSKPSTHELADYKGFFVEGGNRQGHCMFMMSIQTLPPDSMQVSLNALLVLGKN